MRRAPRAPAGAAQARFVNAILHHRRVHTGPRVPRPSNRAGRTFSLPVDIVGMEIVPYLLPRMDGEFSSAWSARKAPAKWNSWMGLQCALAKSHLRPFRHNRPVPFQMCLSRKRSQSGSLLTFGGLVLCSTNSSSSKPRWTLKS